MSRSVYRLICSRALCCLAGLFLGHATLRTAAAQPVDYAREIKPILAEHCYRCHGASQQKGELRADTARSLLRGGETGAGLSPGHSSSSLVIEVLKGAHDTISQMPYKKPPLTAEQINLLERWIDQGALAPDDEQPQSTIHWAYVPPQRLDPPQVSGSRHPIDRFVQDRLAKTGLSPSPEAERIVLIRRLKLDLLGLPPTVAEVDEFLRDDQPGAYERLVERFLASAHYGERWGRWWLDAARYGDSNGYSIDAPRQIWKYRDWVVDAINQDQSFDQFALEQLAGDLLPNASIEQKIATGFNRNTQINQEGGIDPEQFRVEAVMDRVNTFGTVFLGLTVACAQCHDHKFDAISQREYYQLYAFFNNTIEDGHGRSAPLGMLEVPGEIETADAWEKEMEEARAELNRYLDAKGNSAVQWEESLDAAVREKLKGPVQAALKVPWSDRSLDQKRAVYAAFNPDDPEFKSRNSRVARLEKQEPKPVTTLVMEELPSPRETHLFIKGDFTRPGQKVTPGAIAALHKMKPAEGPLNRLDLARWLVDPANPVMARVIVNRVWQQYFGRGIVETENDFGTQGIPPTHPELLDWLAVEFMHPSVPGVRPWSLKHIHRLIVKSATYRQSSQVRPDAFSIDANNKFLARQSRLRLDAEVVRDVALSASGLLSAQIGGPPVYPPQPDGVMSLGQVRREWKASTGANRYRRALYTHLWRATPHPALSVFDAPDGFSTCTRRIRSNTPLQALTLLNDQQFFEFAESLAARLEKETTDPIGHGFKLCLGRTPSSVERTRLEQLLETERDPREGNLLLARVLLNLDETITRE